MIPKQGPWRIMMTFSKADRAQNGYFYLKTEEGSMIRNLNLVAKALKYVKKK